MTNGSLATYMGYQYQSDGQGYEVIEIEMFISVGVK
jgi:hypothetical protein